MAGERCGPQGSERDLGVTSGRSVTDGLWEPGEGRVWPDLEEGEGAAAFRGQDPFSSGSPPSSLSFCPLPLLFLPLLARDLELSYYTRLLAASLAAGSAFQVHSPFRHTSHPPHRCPWEGDQSPSCSFILLLWALSLMPLSPFLSKCLKSDTHPPWAVWTLWVSLLGNHIMLAARRSPGHSVQFLEQAFVRDPPHVPRVPLNNVRAGVLTECFLQFVTLRMILPPAPNSYYLWMFISIVVLPLLKRSMWCIWLLDFFLIVLYPLSKSDFIEEVSVFF